MRGFRGDLGWIHAREGHAGRAYWPGGASGVTFDPGVDLGHASEELVSLYKGMLSAEQWAAVERVRGLRGRLARNALRDDPILRSIRIGSDHASAIFPAAAAPYWAAIVRRFPGVGEPGTPTAVQTAVLSLAYNRGPGNRHLAVLMAPIQRKDWALVADAIGAMQQDHSLEGIRRRRRAEAQLIRDGLKRGKP